MGGHGDLLRGRERTRDRLHLGMTPPSAGIGFELRGHITPIETGQPRRTRAIAAPVDAVTGDASVGRTRIAAAHSQQFATRGEAVCRSAFDRAAARQGNARQNPKCAPIHRDREPSGHGDGSGRETSVTAYREGGSLPDVRILLLMVLPMLMLGACKPPPDAEHHMPEASAQRGLIAVQRAGCGACHRIPGLAWPQGRSGPSLEGFADQGLIAGRLPNRPDMLAAYVRDAPATLPGTTMPAMPLTPGEGRDVAAYLYSTGDR
jgi:hypothetical protein